LLRALILAIICNSSVERTYKAEVMSFLRKREKDESISCNRLLLSIESTAEPRLTVPL